MLVVSYEQMHADVRSVARRLATHLGVEVTEGQMDEVDVSHPHPLTH